MTKALATLRAGCKINLFLRVKERLADGYHNLESLFLPLAEPHDEIRIHAAPAGTGCSVSFYTMASPPLPLAGIDAATNTLARAHAAYARATGFAPDIALDVFKGIAHGGGLGGGSSDAAALLLWLQQAAKETGASPLDEERLISLAASVGADVPFFLVNRPAFVGGIGQKLQACSLPLAAYTVVLVCPPLSVSTGRAFAALDEKRGAGIPATNRHESPVTVLTSDGQKARNVIALAANYGNDFEDVVFAAYPELQRLFDRLAGSGALTARMSGTGSTLFAVYDDEKIAEKVTNSLAMDGLSVYMQRLSDS